MDWLTDIEAAIADLDETGALLRTYTWGPGIDNLLAMTVHDGESSETYFALTDHLGTVHALADATGTIVESYRYDAWGNVLGVYDATGTPIPNQQSAISNRFLFHGREYSWATGLYNFRARWYDPITGRWLSKDPIGNSGGLNQYVFCANNPVIFVDPEGLVVEDPIRAGLQFTRADVLRAINMARHANIPPPDNLQSWAEFWKILDGPGYVVAWNSECAGFVPETRKHRFGKGVYDTYAEKRKTRGQKCLCV